MDVSWVLKNLQTKPEKKSEDLTDGPTMDEVKVRAYGEIEFKGAAKRAKSKVSLSFF